MAEPEVRIEGFQAVVDEALQDIEMAGEDDAEVLEVEDAANGDGADLEDAGQVGTSARTTFVDYLKSPIIELLVGQGEDQTLLTAHQALLTKSPFFADAVAQFSDEATTRRIEFANEDLDAVGCFLQYLYTGEYFPKKIGDALESDPAQSMNGDDGEQLLKHAKVYTLADKLGVMELKSLAHSKVHRVNSTARGELAYARFVYANTPRTDSTIRKPIASFWGQRSHVLRHEAEDDFRALCLEYPEFGFDVLSFVLDARERKGVEAEPKSGRKRARAV
ncbi:hypothetical protein MMC11_004182 [Xylographa trunciseda]|nr:hypothetical protein [Xylographa trunciseda]